MTAWSLAFARVHLFAMPAPPRPAALTPDLVLRFQQLGVTVGPQVPVDGPAGTLPGLLPLEEAVPGRVVESAHGRCYVSDHRRAAGEPHAGAPLDLALEACTDSLAALARDGRLRELDIGRTAFLDTETTGLSSGAGTYAFLVGIGRFVEGAFHVRQFFMRDPSEERAQLVEAADWVDGCDGLVTFNGRSFDMPLLATRYTMHRLRAPLARALHLDLLPPSRRLWRRRLPNCTLQSLERHVLGLERVDDVPGWLVPQRYFRYQEDGDGRPLVGVFQHNALDIVTMVALVERIASAYRRPEEVVRHGPDWLSLARAYAAAGEGPRAIAACEGALARGLAPNEADEAVETMGLVAKRAGDWARAVAVWTDMAGQARPRRLFAFEELAKYYEHRADPREPERALALCRRARELVRSGTLRPRRGRHVALAELDHRIGRLERRAGR